ncbi:hypothetical protein BB170200_05381 [Mycobacterium marinum]|nr:hypothetical protein BB170200_05381 [Mycobacterium marinum]
MRGPARIGLWLLALGAPLGWPIGLGDLRPHTLRKLGSVNPRSILQAHIDFIMMVIILVAVGTAIDSAHSGFKFSSWSERR